MIRALPPFRDLAVYTGSHSFQLLTALAAGSFGLSRFGITGQPAASPKHTSASLTFFPQFESFEKITNEGSHSKTGVLIDFSP